MIFGNLHTEAHSKPSQDRAFFKNTYMLLIMMNKPNNAVPTYELLKYSQFSPFATE